MNSQVFASFLCYATSWKENISNQFLGKELNLRQNTCAQLMLWSGAYTSLRGWGRGS